MRHARFTALTKLLQFQTRLERFLVLGGVVVNAVAFGTLKFDQVILRHNQEAAPARAVEPAAGFEPATICLQNRRSTTELRRHEALWGENTGIKQTRQGSKKPAHGRLSGGGWGRVRTFEGTRPADLQSAPFDHFGTHPGAVDRD